jgi:hypothetical protein
MNEQQLAAVKQALELMHNRGDVGVDEWIAAEAAIKQVIAQDALHKMAEESRTSGLRLDDWDKIGCVNHDCDQCKAVQEPVFCEYCGGNDDADFGLPTDHCTDCARPQPAAQPAPVQEPVATLFGSLPVYDTTPPAPQPAPLTCKHEWFRTGAMEPGECRCINCGMWNTTAPPAPQPVPVKCWCHKCNEHNTVNGLPFSMTQMILCPECGNKRCPKASDHQLDCTGSNEPNQPGSVYTAPQPVPVKTYHDGKPWPVAPAPWVGLTDEEIDTWNIVGHESLREFVRAIEAKLKEKNT